MMYQARRLNYRSLLWVSAALLSARAPKISATALDSSSSSRSSHSINKPPAATTTSSSPLISTGLVNLANTCYLNSQLQCAFHIPLVRNLILSPTIPSALKPPDDDSVALSSSDSSTTMDDPEIEVLPQKQQQQQQQPQQPAAAPGLQALRLVFQDMVNAASINSSNNNEMSSSSSGSSISSLNTVAVSPRVFTRALGIDILEQQDAQEFWKLLLPALNIPALTDLYQGAFQDYIVALDGSGRERRREEPFLDLSLDVTQPPSAAATTTMPESSSVLLSLKHMFGQPELLSKAEGNGWRPEKDADKVDAHKGSRLRTPGLPSILQLHLKRFNYDWNTETMNKINDPFSFPKELNLSCVIQDDNNDNSPNQKELAIYDLQAIVVHMGIYGQGHYYSYIRPDVRNDDWYRFDDEQVTPVSYQQVVADATGGKQPSSASAELVEPPQQQQKQHGGAGGSGPLAFLRALFRGKSSHGYGYGGRTSNAYVIQYVRRCDIPMLYDNDNMHNLVDTKP